MPEQKHGAPREGGKAFWRILAAATLSGAILFWVDHLFHAELGNFGIRLETLSALFFSFVGLHVSVEMAIHYRRVWIPHLFLILVIIFQIWFVHHLLVTHPRPSTTQPFEYPPY